MVGVGEADTDGLVDEEDIGVSVPGFMMEGGPVRTQSATRTYSRH